VSSQSGCHIFQFSLNIDVISPKAFANDARSEEDLLLEGVAASHFVLHATLTSDHIDIFNPRLKGVHLAPVLEYPVVIAVDIS